MYFGLSIPAHVVLRTAALYQKETRALPGIVTLAMGITLWLIQIVGAVRSSDPEAEIFSPGFPLVLLVLSFVIYGVTDWLVKRLAPRRKPDR